jgi:ribosomal protein L29
MLSPFMYLLARRLMELLAFYFQSRASQALEIVVSYHQLEILRRQIW